MEVVEEYQLVKQYFISLAQCFLLLIETYLWSSFRGSKICCMTVDPRPFGLEEKNICCAKLSLLKSCDFHVDVFMWIF
jgi:hypothetical protein